MEERHRTYERSTAGAEGQDFRSSTTVLTLDPEDVADNLVNLVIRRSFRLSLQIASVINANPSIEHELYPLIEEADAIIREVRRFRNEGFCGPP